MGPPDRLLIHEIHNHHEIHININTCIQLLHGDVSYKRNYISINRISAHSITINTLLFCAEANRSKCGLSPAMCKFHMVLNFHKAVIYVCFRLKAIASSIVLRQSFEKWWDIIWRWNNHNVWCCLILITLSWRYQLALWATWCNWTISLNEQIWFQLGFLCLQHFHWPPRGLSLYKVYIVKPTVSWF